MRDKKIIGTQCEDVILEFKIRSLEYEGKTKPFKNKNGKWIVPTKPCISVWGYE